jgi:hypothetical protein
VSKRSGWCPPVLLHSSYPGNGSYSMGLGEWCWSEGLPSPAMEPLLPSQAGATPGDISISPGAMYL